MNTRALDLVVMLRSLLGMLPGATAISFHTIGTWAIVLISASSDDAVIALGEDLGLGCDLRIAADRWWRRATSEHDRGSVRVEVAGPHHRGPPPRDDAGGGAP